jgi:hypothetical protein
MMLRTVLIAGCLALLGCKKEEGTSNPDDADNLLGTENAGGGGGGTKRTGEAVPVKCISDPADPDCKELLDVEQTDDGSLEFGPACRENVCYGKGDCGLDAEGAVACECDEGAGGLNCEGKG